MKGIVLAGGTGSRLHPITRAICKQLLPVYDKPMIYYPLSTLMLAGIRDVLVICDPASPDAFHRLLGDGSQWGMSISYAVQDQPRGIADAFRVGADFVSGEPVALVLGDNLFHGLADRLPEAVAKLDGCTLFGFEVTDPRRYGVLEFDSSGRAVNIEEKPGEPKSRLAVTGLYVYDGFVADVAGELAPSARGELEITDVNNHYLHAGRADVVELGQGTAWLDMGTPDSLVEATHFVQVLEHRQGVRVACLEEVALRMGYIDAEQALSLGTAMKSPYGEYVVAAAHAAGR